MKLKAIFSIAAVTLFAACGSPYRATDTTVMVAPTTTQTVFSTQYPYARNVVWMRYDAAYVPIDWELAGWTTADENDYLVRFDLDNNLHYAWYDEEGNWIGTSYAVVDYSTMPLSVNTTLRERYPGYTIMKAHREFKGDQVAYEVELKSDDVNVKLLLDQNGNIIRSKSKSLN